MEKNKFFNENDFRNITNEQDTNYNKSADSYGNSKDEYSDRIYVDDTRGKAVMYDRRNPFVKLILIILGVVAIIGTIYYIYVYFTTMRWFR